MKYAMFTGYSMASFLYLCVGILGYATYGNEVYIYINNVLDLNKLFKEY